MSQTITHTKQPREFPWRFIGSLIQVRESLISKIISGLNRIVKTRRPQFNARSKHQSFMDANLLDATMGPEISRTLRR